MPTSKDEQAVLLAEAHYATEAGIKQIFRITEQADMESRPEVPIKLLEVNEDTIPSGIMPLQFGPAPAIGIHSPSVIVEVTPHEFQLVQNAALPLPDGWRVGDLIPKPAVHGAP